MKRVLIVALLLLLAVAAIVLLYREQARQFAYDALTKDMFVAEDKDDFDPGPQLGSSFPGVNASWQGRPVRVLQEFAGPKGTMLVATRSADWCPYCMRQMIELQAHKAAYDAAGIGLVAITYDEPALQRAFVEKWGISYPVLHDIDTLSFKTLGILNEDYQPGDSAYGIPHPGAIVIDPQGKVVGKLFLEDYSVRVDALSALAFAKAALAIEP